MSIAVMSFNNQVLILWLENFSRWWSLPPLSESSDNKHFDIDDIRDEENSDEDIDSLLPDEFPALAPHGQLGMARSRRGGKEWAHMVDLNHDISNFKELVPGKAKTCVR